MGNNNPQGGNKKTFRFNLYWMYALIALSLIGVYYMNDGSSSKEVTWSEFEQIARYGKEIKEIAWWLCKNEMIEFLGSDLHNLDQARAIGEWLATKEYHKAAEMLATIQNDQLATY